MGVGVEGWARGLGSEDWGLGVGVGDLGLEGWGGGWSRGIGVEWLGSGGAGVGGVGSLISFPCDSYMVLFFPSQAIFDFDTYLMQP